MNAAKRYWQSMDTGDRYLFKKHLFYIAADSVEALTGAFGGLITHKIDQHVAFTMVISSLTFITAVEVPGMAASVIPNKYRRTRNGLKQFSGIMGAVAGGIYLTSGIKFHNRSMEIIGGAFTASPLIELVPESKNHTDNPPQRIRQIIQNGLRHPPLWAGLANGAGLFTMFCMLRSVPAAQIAPMVALGLLAAAYQVRATGIEPRISGMEPK